MAGAASGNDRVVIALLMAVMFVSGADLLVINPTLPQMARDLGVDVEVAGLWVTAYAVSTGTFALLFGPVSDRYGRRPILRLGIAVLTVGTTVCGFMDSYFGLLGARFLAGAGAGMIVTSLTSFVGDHFGAKDRAIAMGWVMNGFFISLILAVPLGAWLAETFGWREMFVILGVATGTIALLLFTTLPEARFEQCTDCLELGRAVRGYTALITTPCSLGILVFSTSVGVAMTMFSVYTSPWLEETYGMNTLQRGLMYMVGGPALLVGGPLSGRLANALGRVRVITLGSALLIAMLVVMPFSFAPSRALEGFMYDGIGPLWFQALGSLVVFFGLMLAGSIRAGPFFTLAMEVVGPGERGTMSALRHAANQLGAAAGASLGGLVWAHAGARYVVICWTAALVSVAGVAILRRLSGPRSVDSQAAPAPAVAT